jgi:hypothetical protein
MRDLKNMSLLAIWRNASSRRRRIYSIIAVFVVAFIVTVAGSLVSVSTEQAQQINDELNQTLNTASQSGALIQYIFGNNFFICLLMFIPILGPLFGLFVLFNTGTAVSAVATAQGVPSIFALVALIITPIFWLEFAAYSTGMAESVWLFRRLIQGKRRGLHELRNACIFISICAVLLIIGAVTEAVLISIGA